MFSTRNVYRFAVLVRKSDAERTIEKLIALGVFHPKKVEKSFDGPFSSRSATRFLPYEKKIADITAKMEAAGLTCSGRLKIDDRDKFLDSAVKDLATLEQKAEANKAVSADLLRLKAASELLDFKKAVSELSKSSEMADGFVIIEGWVDKGSLPVLKKECDGPNTLFEYIEGVDGPTLLKNRWPFSLFEYVSKLYPPFRYGSVDITPIIAITFPIIFGVMFASVLDGLILLIIAALWYWRSRGEMPQLLAILAMSAIFFGFLFGESSFFGTGPVIDVYSNPILLIEISIGIGFVHITIGHLLGIANCLSEGNKKEAVAHVGYILLMFSALAFLLSPPISYAGIAISVLMIISGGVKSISEIPHAIGHLFSYARIFAISISHYSIAAVFDALAGKFGWTTPEGILVSLIILMCGHFILLTIELLIALVHTLRLHILEFGTKFMSTGTEWFNPYKVMNRYSDVGSVGKMIKRSSDAAVT